MTNGPLDEGKLDTVTSVMIFNCDSCNREIKTPGEWIRTKNGVICDRCYQRMLFPNMKISFGDNF